MIIPRSCSSTTLRGTCYISIIALGWRGMVARLGERNHLEQRREWALSSMLHASGRRGGVETANVRRGRTVSIEEMN